MSKTESILDVYISGQLCGYLTEHRYGMITFEYDRGYRGVPLSLSMPLSLARYDDRIVRPFLMGLLPDEPSTRTAIGAHQGISGNNPFRLLSIIGLDCPGAVQVCAHQVAPSSPNNAAGFIEATESDMEAKLASVKQNAATAWTYGSETEGHWSLAGCQAKFAMRLKGNRWYECTGSAATTHIVKPGVVGFDNQALVEYLSMKAAKAVGLPVANVAYRTFGSEPAIVIERYDRVETPAGEVVRIHQEDFCQAMSVSPETKYAEQGGPSTPQIIEMLKTTGSNARDNIYRFILFMFFNYLIGATDAHAKTIRFSSLRRTTYGSHPSTTSRPSRPIETLCPKGASPCGPRCRSVEKIDSEDLSLRIFRKWLITATSIIGKSMRVFFRTDSLQWLS